MAEKIFGWSRSEAIGASLLDTIVPERFRQAHEHGMKVYLNDGSGLWLYRSITTTARHNDGSEFSIEMAIIPLSSGDEQTFYAFIRKADRADHEQPQ
jgi:PAS domain S-box-containing protein